MAANPILEESSGSGAIIDGLAGWHDSEPGADTELSARARPERRLAIYPASAGFDLVEELDFLCKRTIEPNIFFNPRFLAPAMPRLEDREVRLAVIRDGGENRSRLRLLVPFSVEAPVVPLGVPTLRTWSNPFGPLGTPLVDEDDPQGVLEDFFGMLARPHLKLPKVFVLPDVRLDGPFAETLRAVVKRHKLALQTLGEVERPLLQSTLDGDTYLRNSLRAHHFREFRRLKRRLEMQGPVDHLVLRDAQEIRVGVEVFLSLEAAGWKGRNRSAMATDRFRAAFAREAISRLAEQDLARVHLLRVGERVIAALVVFIERGIGYTWKTAYDEEFAAFSPGTLLMIEVTRMHLADRGIIATDSCAMPDHPVMSRLWSERMPIGTFVVGLEPGREKQVAQAAKQLELYRNTRNQFRLVRNRLRGLLRRR